MIDPRALQQHFNNVRQKEQPPAKLIPRVPDPISLVAGHVVPITEPILETEIEEPKVQEVIEVPQEVEIEPLVAPIPEIKETPIVEDRPVAKEEPDVYDPYGYYSGPVFRNQRDL